jgi:hypothetical protein
LSELIKRLLPRGDDAAIRAMCASIGLIDEKAWRTLLESGSSVASSGIRFSEAEIDAALTKNAPDLLIEDKRTFKAALAGHRLIRRIAGNHLVERIRA